MAEINDYLGSGKRLQDAVRVPIDRTIGLLSNHLAPKTAPSINTPRTQKPPQPRKLPVIQQSQPSTDTYPPGNSYSPYVAPAAPAASAAPVASTGSHVDARNDYLQNPMAAQSQTYPDPQYTYHTPYTSSPYAPSSCASSDVLPATAAAANAYLHHYPHQPTPLHPTYPSDMNNIANNTYNQYHSPGSPTSWRNWAGSIASNLEPGAEYMNSASALMQLGRSEAQVSQEFTVDSTTGQVWPLMLFGAGAGSGP